MFSTSFTHSKKKVKQKIVNELEHLVGFLYVHDVETIPFELLDGILLGH